MKPHDGPVCVTGATGFVASHLTMQLLDEGYTVHGTVRNPATATHITGLPGAKERLTLFQADLLDQGAYHEAMAGCVGVFHTASPYQLTVADPQRDLVAPAVDGTRNILQTADGTESLRRVVLTSSMAAIADEPAPHPLSESDWNEESNLKRNPYYYSKTEAERTAWSHVAKGRHFDLVVINPGLVIGPACSSSINPSVGAIRDLMTRATPAVVSLHWPIVDVRDVAAAHIAAMKTAAANGRYVCVAASWPMKAVADVLAEHGHRTPRLNLTGRVGTVLSEFVAKFQPKGIRSYLKTHLGKALLVDNSKIKRELGIVFRTPRQSIVDTADDLVARGHVPSPDQG